MTRLRAPSVDGAVLCEPGWESWPTLVAENRRRLSAWRGELLGRPLDDLRQAARGELLRAALDYTATYRTLPAMALAELLERPFILGGHQPELFHPGVWLKNFALDELARRVEGVAINLVIDADACKHVELPVPVVDGERVERQLVAFDAPSDPCVHEDRAVVDPEVFASFGERVADKLAPLLADPLLRVVWPQIVERARHTHRIALAFAQTRHRWEAEFGLNTLELPQSVLSSLPVWQHFLAHLIAERHRFCAVYNQAIRDYRRRYRLRSASHPAPELRTSGHRVELPFWVWLDKHSPRPTTLTIDDADPAPPSGARLRTKALTTTLFARLFLGDLFVHGLGGGMYDQVTDQIMREFYGLEPPHYTICTGTLRLPVKLPAISADAVHRHRAERWSMRHHPEVWIDATRASAETRAWIAQKQQWVALRPTHTTARERCRAIRELNARLYAQLGAREQQWSVEQRQLETAWRGAQLLASREYPWLWYPRETLANFLLAFRTPRP